MNEGMMNEWNNKWMNDLYLSIREKLFKIKAY